MDFGQMLDLAALALWSAPNQMGVLLPSAQSVLAGSSLLKVKGT